MIQKIQSFFQVSGLSLNNDKREILAIGCQEEDVNNLVQNTGLRRVFRMKHLGTIITDSPVVTMEHNFEPMVETLEALYQETRDCYSTPLGRSLFCSKYYHRLLNATIDPEMSKRPFQTTLNMLWSRSRTDSETR